MHLRPYQEHAISDLRAALESHRAALYVLPTGGGKTRISAEIIRRVAASGKRAYFGVHRVELVEQTSTALTQAGITHGIVSPGYPQTDDAVQVASVFTLARRLGNYQPPDLYIQDEAHHTLTSNTWGRVINWLPQSSKIIGVTATPQRLDGRGLGDVFETLIMGPTPQELIDAGYLSTPVLYAPPLPVNLDGIPIRAGDYAREQLALEMDRPTITGQAVDHYVTLARGLQTLVFCTSVAHAENTAVAFNRANIPATSIDGSLSRQERSDRIKGFAAGRYQALMSCDLIGEGFDLDLLAGSSIPIACIMVLRPTRSLALWLQMLGRGLRPHADKSHTLIIDAVQNWRDLGLPQTPRQWALTKTRAKRAKHDPDISIKQCPQCYAVDEPAPACALCGYVFPVVQRRMIETIAGELVPIDSETARLEIERRRKMARSLEELIAVEHQAGYKHGWALNVWNARKNKYKVETFTK